MANFSHFFILPLDKSLNLWYNKTSKNGVKKERNSNQLVDLNISRINTRIHKTCTVSMATSMWVFPLQMPAVAVLTVRVFLETDMHLFLPFSIFY